MMVVLLFGAGCQAMTGKTAGENVDDASITARVKAKLVAEKAANLTRVDVDTTNRTVYLNGVVQSPEERTRAEELASSVSGVKQVVNNLQVEKRGASLGK
jgi:hyperosmotically inducible protein